MLSHLSSPISSALFVVLSSSSQIWANKGPVYSSGLYPYMAVSLKVIHIFIHILRFNHLVCSAVGHGQIILKYSYSAGSCCVFVLWNMIISHFKATYPWMLLLKVLKVSTPIDFWHSFGPLCAFHDQIIIMGQLKYFVIAVISSAVFICVLCFLFANCHHIPSVSSLLYSSFF